MNREYLNSFQIRHNQKNDMVQLSLVYTKPSGSVRRVSLFGVFHSSAVVCRAIADRRWERELWLDVQFSERVRAGELKRKWWKRVINWRQHRQKAVYIFVLVSLFE